LSIDSGCVWNKNVIQSITEMKEDKLMKKIKLIRDKLKVKTDKVKTDKVKTDKVKTDKVKTDKVKTDKVKTDKVK